ncbi:MAG: ABC transporter permease [Saprospiraceae bacterium]|nr:ABC transporter permease [Saprospiraceae bacterium]
MFYNYLKTAFRNLWRKRQISMINFIGMWVALTVVLLIFLFVRDEQSFDQFHANKHDIYRVTNQSVNGYFGDYKSGFTGIPQGPSFTENIDEVESFVRVKGYPELVRLDGETFYGDMLYVDSTFFDIFSFEVLQGAGPDQLLEPHQLVLSARQAEILFGEDNPIGQVVEIQEEEDKFSELTVIGVAQTPPANSSLQFDFILPFKRYLLAEHPERQQDWIGSNLNTFLKLKEGAETDRVIAKMAAIADEKMAPQLAEIKEAKPDARHWFELQPLLDVHLEEELYISNGLERGSNPQYSYILIGVAFLVLLLACINFINLSLAQSMDRGREVGVRKVIGSSRKQLVFQFLSESWLLVGLAVLPALVAVQWLLPFFNNFTGKYISTQVLAELPVIGAILLFHWGLAILAGFYPALILSGFKPVQAIVNKVRLSGRHSWAKGLVVVQFSLAILFVLAAVLFHQQFRFLQDKELGFDPSNIIGMEIPWFISPELAPLIKEDLAQYPFIEQVTARANISKHGVNRTRINYEGDQSIMAAYGSIDANFIPAFGIQVLQGENFNALRSTDSLNRVLVNETFVKSVQWDDPIGKVVRWGDNSMEVIGVVKDFHLESLKESIKPLVLYSKPDARVKEIWVKVQDQYAAQTVKLLEETHEKHLGYLPFEYSFLENDISAYYESEARWKKMINWASGLMLLIAALGIMGLSALLVVQRKQEIGIRKILGATVGQLVQLLSLPLIRLVGIAFLIASPMAWWLGNKWLSTNYAFYVELHWSFFVIVGIGTLLLASLTVGREAMVHARANPIDSLQQD